MKEFSPFTKCQEADFILVFSSCIINTIKAELMNIYFCLSEESDQPWFSDCKQQKWTLACLRLGGCKLMEKAVQKWKASFLKSGGWRLTWEMDGSVICHSFGKRAWLAKSGFCASSLDKSSNVMPCVGWLPIWLQLVGKGNNFGTNHKSPQQKYTICNIKRHMSSR